MSKIISQLKQAEQKRKTHKTFSNRGHAHMALWIVGVASIIVTVILLLLNVRVLHLTRNYYANHDYFREKLNRIEYLLTKNDNRVESIIVNSKQVTSDLDTIKIKIKNVQEQINQLTQDADARTVSMENLTKAKDTLFKKLSALEIELDKIKSKVSDTTKM